MKVRMILSALFAVGLLAAVAAGLGAWTSNAAGMPGADPGDTGTVARIALTIEGGQSVSFRSFEIRSGFESSELSLETRGVTLPVKRTPPTITLERGMDSNMDMWVWHEAALAGAVGSRKSASLVMYNVEGTPVARFNLEHAWPSKVQESNLEAGAPAPVLETVQIVADSVQRVAP